MKALIAMMTILGTVAAARAQVAPEATSPGKLSISGTLTYSARYTQMAEFYSNGGNGQVANLSGSFGYSTTSERHPTAVTLGAGDSWTISGMGYNSGPYEDLSVSQGIVGQHWSLRLGDSVTYYKGVSNGQPNLTSSTNEALPTLDTTTVNNDATAEYSYKFSAFSTLSAGGGYNQLYYPNGNGLNTNALMANLGLNRRLGARNTLFGTYRFSQYSYSTNDITIDANTGIIGWQRTWTRHVSSSVSAGPQWVSSSENSLLPPSTGVFANASITDSNKSGSASLSYTHELEGGGGYMYGAETDDIIGSFGRHFGHQVRSQISVELAGGYRRTASLEPQASPGAINGVIDSKYGTAQAGRKLGRLFSVYAGYTGTVQSSSSSASSSPLNGLWQTISFGIGFTPPQIHLRQ